VEALKKTKRFHHRQEKRKKTGARAWPYPGVEKTPRPRSLGNAGKKNRGESLVNEKKGKERLAATRKR